MIPFIILILLPVFCCFVAIKKNGKKNKIICMGSSSYIQENSLAIPIFFFSFFLLLALRAESVGRDISGYAYYFDVFQSLSWRQMLAYDLDILFKILLWGIGRITDSFHVFLAVVAGLTMLPIAMVYQQDRRHSYLKIILFTGVGIFSMFFSGIRQCLAMAVGMIAYSYTKERKLLPFLLSVMFAIGFHHSAFILLFMYPVYYANFKTKHLWFVVPTIVTVFVLRKQVFGLLDLVFSGYDFTQVTTGAYGSLLVFVLFAVFSYVIPDEKKMDRELLGLRNLLLLSVVLQCFAPVHSLAMRFNYYYLLFIPLLLPQIIDIPKTKWRQVAAFSRYVLSAFYTLVYADMLITFHNTGRSSLDILPYVPFWKG